MQDTATAYGWVEPPSRDETVTANPHIETPPDFTRVGDGLHFPEGPAYDGRGNIAVSNCDADYVTQFDAAGNARVLWRADEKQWTFQRTLYGPGLVGVIDPDGDLVHGVQLPGKAATNVEFAGADLQTLYITETETGALFKMRVETPGAPLFCAPPNLGAAP